MRLWRLKYKCRNCGGFVFGDDHYNDIDFTMNRNICGVFFTEEPRHNRFVYHKCKNGEKGLCDFMAAQKVKK